MIKTISITPFILLAILILLILRFFGLAEIENLELIGYAFIFYGINKAYQGLTLRYGGLLFTGTIVFLIGCFTFVVYNFEIYSVEKMIFPAILFAAATGFITLFFIDTKNIPLLLISGVLVFFGFIVTQQIGAVNFSLILLTLQHFFSKYWIIILVLVGLIFIFSKDQMKNS